jgi:hypothetical protein
MIAHYRASLGYLRQLRFPFQVVVLDYAPMADDRW